LNKSEFPGLPVSAEPARVTVAMLRGTPIITPTTSWGVESKSEMDGQTVEDSKGNKGKKKNVKVILKWG
jgi:hypothetical protein